MRRFGDIDTIQALGSDLFSPEARKTLKISSNILRTFLSFTEENL
jgi:hypothetical protein